MTSLENNTLSLDEIYASFKIDEDALLTGQMINYSNDKMLSVEPYTLVNFPTVASITCSKATSIKAYALTMLQSLTSVDFPLVTTIGECAFDNCMSLTSVHIPLATSIGSYAFQATGLTSVDFPLVTTIGECAFTICESLTSITLPSVTSIGAYAFSFCTSLTSVTLGASTVVAIEDGSGIFDNTPIASGTGYIYVPPELVESYKTATNWSTYVSQIRPIGIDVVNLTITNNNISEYTIEYTDILNTVQTITIANAATVTYMIKQGGLLKITGNGVTCAIIATEDINIFISNEGIVNVIPNIINVNLHRQYQDGNFGLTINIGNQVYDFDYVDYFFYDNIVELDTISNGNTISITNNNNYNIYHNGKLLENTANPCEISLTKNTSIIFDHAENIVVIEHGYDINNTSINNAPITFAVMGHINTSNGMPSTINSTIILFTPGMTFSDYCNSMYNYQGFKINGTTVTNSSGTSNICNWVYGGTPSPVSSSSFISYGEVYVYS